MYVTCQHEQVEELQTGDRLYMYNTTCINILQVRNLTGTNEHEIKKKI